MGLAAEFACGLRVDEAWDSGYGRLVRIYELPQFISRQVSHLTDLSTGQGGPAKQQETVDIRIRIKPSIGLASTRANRTITPFPGANHIGSETRSP